MKSPTHTREPSDLSSSNLDSVAAARRERILQATVTVMSEHGYRKATISRIAAAAGVPRTGFYVFFHNKEDALRAILANTDTQTCNKVQTASASAESWPDRVYLGLRELLAFFSTRPQLARVVFVEAQAAGSPVLGTVNDDIHYYARCFASPPAIPRAKSGSAGAFTAQVFGAIYFRLYEAITTGEVAALPDLLPEVIEIALTPYIGGEGVQALLDTHRET